MATNKKYAVFILISFTIFIIIRSVYLKITYNKLSENRTYTTGLVTKVNRISKGGGAIYYEYVVGNQRKVGSKVYGNIDESAKILIGKRFPLIYNASDINTNEILINKNDFNAYSVSFPDSLIWVEPIFN